MVKRSAVNCMTLVAMVSALYLTCGRLVLSADAATNLARGAVCSFSPAARYPHTHSRNDPMKLTDGRKAFGHFWTSRASTVGWINSGVIRVDMDLNRIGSVDYVTVHSARGKNADVSFPHRIDIYASMDGKNYRYLGNMLETADLSDGAYAKRWFSSQTLNSQARFLTMFITPQGDFTFIDEIEVMGKWIRKSRPESDYPLKKDLLAGYQAHLAKCRQRLDALTYMSSQMSPGAENNAPFVSADIKTAQHDLGILEQEMFAEHARRLRKNFSADVLVWKTPPWEPFSPVASPDWNFTRRQCRFDVMQGGTVSDSFGIVSVDDSAAKVRISIEGPYKKGPFPSLFIKEAVPVATATGQVLADPLIPLVDETLDMRLGESRQIWLTVQGDAPPGVYDGRIMIRMAAANRKDQSIPFRVTVWPVSISPDRLPAVNVWSYLNWRPIAACPKAASKDLRAHHANVAIVHPSQLPWPAGSHAPSGTNLDFRVFDQVIRQMATCRYFLLYLGFNNPVHRSLGGTHREIDARWRADFIQWATCLVDRLRDLGVESKKIGFYPVDEPDCSTEVALIGEVANLVRQIDSDLRIYTTIDRMSRFSGVDFRALAKATDIAQIHELDLEHRRVELLRGQGKKIWVYNARGGKKGHPFNFYRLQAWKGFKYRVTGLGFWAYADAGPHGTAWDDFDGVRPDFSVIYEGRNSIFSSKRWEAWREGVEDFVLLGLAKNNLSSMGDEAEFSALIENVLAQDMDYSAFNRIRRRLFEMATR